MPGKFCETAEELPGKLWKYITHVLPGTYYEKIAFVRAQALCLQSRLANLGDGAREAAGRRQQLRVEEEMRRREQVAHHLAHVRGRGVPWAGEVFRR